MPEFPLVSPPANLDRFTLDLSIVRTDELISIGGNFLLAELLTGEVYVKLNHLANVAIPLSRVSPIFANFDKIYISNTAQAGEYVILQIGKNYSASGIGKVSIYSPTNIDVFPEPRKREVQFNTVTPLAIAGTYTSAYFECLTFEKVCGIVKADVAGTLYIEQSPDGTNPDYITTIAVGAGVGVAFEVNLVTRYVRGRYLNGATIQTYFRLSGYLEVF